MNKLSLRSIHASLPMAVLATTVFVAFGTAEQAHAAAFQLPTTNAAGFGRGFAGGSLWTDDPSAAYNNPAAMAWLSGPVAQGSWIGIRPSIEYHGSFTDAAGRPMTGGLPNGGGRVISDTSAFYAQPVSDRFAIGLGLTVPYALVTQYRPDWQGREFGTMTSLKSIALSMSAAYKVQDHFSVGFGLVAQRTRAQLNNGLDVGGTLTTLSGVPLSPLSDAQINVRVHNWSWGYFAGAEWKPTQHDSLGVVYHSRILNRLHGQYAMYFPNDGKIDPATGAVINMRDTLEAIPLLNQAYGTHLPDLNPDGAGASSQLNLPAFINIDYLHKFNDAFSLGATVQWTNWSPFKTLELYSQGQQLLSLDTAYRNTYTLSVGGDYKLNQQWTLRSGLAWDQTPTRNPTRDPRIPDNTRRIISAGVGYQYSEHLGFDAAYQHQFLSKATLRQTTLLALGGGSMDGYASDSGDVLALTATYKF
ncbi:outer membrane protein transport protein [Dyella choica]|nr:outer membrane protein transport protein [Dyella choica]